MRRSGKNSTRLLLFVLLLVVAVLSALRFGLVPQRYAPFAPISLDEPPVWFVDARLAALRHDPETCRAVLKTPHIAATPIPDRVRPDGCGWTNAVRIAKVGGAEIGRASCRERVSECV